MTVLLSWQPDHTSVGFCSTVLNFDLSSACLYVLKNLFQPKLFHFVSLPDQPVYRDEGVVQKLLPSFPLSALILQCVQLEPATSPLSMSVTQLPVQQWEESVRASLEEGGQFDVLCATRTMAALLQEFYTGRNVSTLCVQASLNVIYTKSQDTAEKSV